MDYLDWLYEKIKKPDCDIENYQFLLQNLFLSEYYWTNYSDYNRSVDGLALRSNYISLYPDKKDIVLNHLNGKCSVLEMLIALSFRIEHEYMNKKPGIDQTYKWFWKCIDCLELSGMVNSKFNKEKCDDKIARFLSRIVVKGSKTIRIFPPIKRIPHLVKYPIWEQMLAFVSENS